MAPGGAVVEGEVKAGVTYGVKTDAVALEQIDAPDDLGAGDMFPLGAGILGAVGEPDREQEWGGVRINVKLSLLFMSGLLHIVLRAPHVVAALP